MSVEDVFSVWVGCVQRARSWWTRPVGDPRPPRTARRRHAVGENTIPLDDLVARLKTERAKREERAPRHLRVGEPTEQIPAVAGPYLYCGADGYPPVSGNLEGA